MSIYESAIPVMVRKLKALSAFLDKAAAHTLAGWLDGWRARTVIVTGHAALPVVADRVWAPWG